MSLTLDDLLRASEASHRRSLQGREASPHGQAAAPSRPSSEPQPSALVLVTSVYTCECGSTHRSPNPYVLVRYTFPNQRSSANHYQRRGELGPLASLPREHKLLHQTVPYCEACFAAGGDTQKRSAAAAVDCPSPAATAVGSAEP